jgi:hypothetical protein
MEAYYDAAFSIALVVLNAQGWKMTSAQGHHEHTLEARRRPRSTNSVPLPANG